MSKGQCTKERTVKNIRQYLGSFDMNTRYAIQQFLEWFNVDRKLERIVWATLKKSEIIRAKQAEEISETTDLARRLHAGEIKNAAEHKKIVERVINEPGELGPVMGKCPKCGSNIRGNLMKVCGKSAGNFGKLTFYKECTACTYYSEIFKKRNKYIEVEGG